MDITILHNKACNIWRTTQRIIGAILKKNGLSEKVQEIVIANDAEARAHHFSGSPQVLVGGKDIDPMAGQITNYHESGCRFYLWNDTLHEGPPKEMLEAAIAQYKK